MKVVPELAGAAARRMEEVQAEPASLAGWSAQIGLVG